MQSKVATFAATPDPTFGQQQPTEQTPGDAAEAQVNIPDPVDLRLVIEQDQANGTYVYKTINRRTGEVILQLPRADLLKLRNEAQYAAGAVIRTKA